jgi:hypothetical protein
MMRCRREVRGSWGSRDIIVVSFELVVMDRFAVKFCKRSVNILSFLRSEWKDASL